MLSVAIVVVSIELDRHRRGRVMSLEETVKALHAHDTQVTRQQQACLDAGVRIKKPIQGQFTGKSFCFTGFRDGDLEQKVEKMGGQMKSSVSKGLTYLVCADPNSGSSKLAKARKYGVEVIGRDDLVKMVG